jgi:hypothetical protein
VAGQRWGGRALLVFAGRRWQKRRLLLHQQHHQQRQQAMDLMACLPAFACLQTRW